LEIVDSGGSDQVLESVHGPLGQPVAVYAHIHFPYLRNLPSRCIIKTGSVSLSYNGDRRASYLVLDGSASAIRRVEYDIEREMKALSACGLPHADWIAKTL